MEMINRRLALGTAALNLAAGVTGTGMARRVPLGERCVIRRLRCARQSAQQEPED